MILLDAMRSNKVRQQMTNTVNEAVDGLNEIKDEMDDIKDDVVETKCSCSVTPLLP